MFTSRKDAINAIIQQAPAFSIFLDKYILTEKGRIFMDQVCEVSNVFVFSGIIRDFLLGQICSIRDLDIVIGNMSETEADIFLRRIKIAHHNYRRNNFNGYKIEINDFTVDVWKIEDTWGINYLKNKPNINSLIKSAFFNFSSIAFDYKNKKFIFDENFIDFYTNNVMDIVLPDTPNIPLCLFNIFYYQQRFQFLISENLKNWVRRNLPKCSDFYPIQISHLGAIYFSNEEIIKVLTIISF